MKFHIVASAIWSKSYEARDPIIDKYPCLANYGYIREETQVSVGRTPIKDENGKRIWQETDATRSEYTSYIYIYSLEELMQLIKDCDKCVIVSGDEIEIYDGYRE